MNNNINLILIHHFLYYLYDFIHHNHTIIVIGISFLTEDTLKEQSLCVINTIYTYSGVTRTSFFEGGGDLNICH